MGKIECIREQDGSEVERLMPRGENEKFKTRIGKLSLPLKKRNVKKKIESKNLSPDKFDIEAHLTENETFSEIWESIEDKVQAAQQENWENMSKAELVNELEKYKSIAEKYDEVEFDESI